jgi:dolichol-phosphate mannosyltransferase
MKPLISVIAPMYNEELVIDEYCKETLAVLSSLRERYDYEIILVNDGSRDNTLDKMAAQQQVNPDVISIVNLTRNFGLEGAVHAGLTKAKGDIIVTMDADLQDPPSLIPTMLERFNEGYDIVNAQRAKREHDSFFKRESAALFYKIFQSFSGKLKLEQNVSFYRLFSSTVAQKLLALPEVNPIFRVTMPFIGMKNTVIEYERDKRYAGKSKYNISSLIRYALDALTGISVEPLRKTVLVVPVFVILLVLSIVMCIFARSDWRAVSVVVLFISLSSLIITVLLSVISEYLSQIMLEVKRRPVSIIYEFIPSKASMERTENNAVR